MTEEDQEERLLFLIKKISIQLEMQMERGLRKSDLSGV